MSSAATMAFDLCVLSYVYCGDERETGSHGLKFGLTLFSG